MPSRKIKLGDEIEDVTSRVVGVAIARCEYLSGAVYWVIQPYAVDDNIAPRELYIPEGYAKYKGEGVYPVVKPPVGFHAEDVSDAKKV